MSRYSEDFKEDKRMELEQIELQEIRDREQIVDDDDSELDACDSSGTRMEFNQDDDEPLDGGFY